MPVMPLLASLTSRWSWRNDAVSAQRLHDFALAEHNTFIELTEAAELTEDPARAAAYLRHAVDEARHARAFSARSRALGGRQAWVRADSSALFRTLGEPAFLAFVSRGEARAVQQFTAYVAWFEARQQPRMAKLFRALLPDEDRHAQYSAALLHRVAGPEHTRLLRTTALSELWSGWMRLGRATSDGLFYVAIWACTPLIWPLSWYVRWVRPAPKGL